MEIYAQGPEEKVEGFIAEIQNNPPRRAAILKINVEKIENSGDIHSLISSRARRQRVKFLFLRISQSVRNAKRKCLIRRIGDICIRLSTAPVADRD